jgi:hypothetical protein
MRIGATASAVTPKVKAQYDGANGCARSRGIRRTSTRASNRP